MPHVQSYKLLMPGPGGSLYTERENSSLYPLHHVTRLQTDRLCTRQPSAAQHTRPGQGDTTHFQHHTLPPSLQVLRAV